MLLAAVRSERDGGSVVGTGGPPQPDPGAGAGSLGNSLLSAGGGTAPSPPPWASPPPPKLVCSQSCRGHTPHVSRQYCWRWASVKGSSGNRSDTLLLENVRLISVQACGMPHHDQAGPCSPRPPAPRTRLSRAPSTPVPGSPRAPSTPCTHQSQGLQPSRTRPPWAPSHPNLVVPGLGVTAQAAARGVGAGLVLQVDLIAGLCARRVVHQPWGEGCWGRVPGHPPCPLRGALLGPRGPSEEWGGGPGGRAVLSALSGLLRAAGQPT